MNLGIDNTQFCTSESCAALTTHGLRENSEAERRPFFLLGVQGSGTNLTASILEAVFGFRGVLDGSLIFQAADRVERDSTPENVRRQFRYVHERFFPGEIARRVRAKHYHNLRRSTPFKGIEQEFDPNQIHSGSDFAWAFYTYPRQTCDESRIFVKSDDLWEDIDRLKVLFPRRRIILLVRDPRDTALSISRKDFGPCDLYISSRLVEKQLNLYRAEAERTPDDYFLVKYEDLLTQPMKFVHGFEQRFGFEVPPDAEARLSKLNIRSENFDKWKKLSPRDVAACEWVLQKHIADLGYEMSGQPLRPVLMSEDLVRQASDLISRVPQRLKRQAKRLLNR